MRLGKANAVYEYLAVKIRKVYSPNRHRKTWKATVAWVQFARGASFDIEDFSQCLEQFSESKSTQHSPYHASEQLQFNTGLEERQNVHI